MESSVYLDRILDALSGSFDVYRPYRMGETQYPAYAYFFSMNEKYVAVRKARLWAVRTYEHILFIETDLCDADTIAQERGVMEAYPDCAFARQIRQLAEAMLEQGE